jgi:hypothetical protein
MERLNEAARDWVPHVRRLQPDMAWEDVVRIVNAPLARERQWTQSRLLRAVTAYVRDGFLPETACPRRPPQNGRPFARHRRSHQRRGSRHHATGNLRPAGNNARTYTPVADKLATLLCEDALGAGREIGTW